jgi:hypothetical protein
LDFWTRKEESTKEKYPEEEEEREREFNELTFETTIGKILEKRLRLIYSWIATDWSTEEEGVEVDRGEGREGRAGVVIVEEEGAVGTEGGGEEEEGREEGCEDGCLLETIWDKSQP